MFRIHIRGVHKASRILGDVHGQRSPPPHVLFIHNSEEKSPWKEMAKRLNIETAANSPYAGAYEISCGTG